MEDTLEYILIGMSIIGGLWWQYYLRRKEKYRGLPLRVKIPIIIGSVFTIGILTHGIIGIYMDEKSVLDWNEVLMNSLKSLVLFLTFTVKSYLGPIFTSLSTAILIYFLFEHSQITIMNFVLRFFEWIFMALPDWVEGAYLIGMGVIVVGGTLKDTFSDSVAERIQDLFS